MSLQDALISKFFHNFDAPNDDGVRFVKNQGQVMGVMGEDPVTVVLMVMFFDWLSGAPSTVELRWLREAVDGRWHFYDTNEEMRYAYDYMLPKRRTVNEVDR